MITGVGFLGILNFPGVRVSDRTELECLRMQVLRRGVNSDFVKIVDVLGRDVVLIAKEADLLDHVGSRFCQNLKTNAVIS